MKKPPPRINFEVSEEFHAEILEATEFFGNRQPGHIGHRLFTKLVTKMNEIKKDPERLKKFNDNLI